VSVSAQGPASRAHSGLPIALDAMGGDRAPEEIVKGALRARDELGIDVLLVGPPDLGDKIDLGGLELAVASETIEMDEEPGSAVRRKKDSTLVRAAEAVRDGRAAAMVSAGNTGAAMASALFRLGRVRGASRPAVATPIPVPGTTPTVLLDAGANAECQPEWLVQFARMGDAFARARYGIEQPRVGLLSIGEEPSKGSPFVKEVHRLLEGEHGLEFVGNVEGRDIMSDRVDVVVTDGFTGNVALKAMEGAVRFLVHKILDALQADQGVAPHLGTVLGALGPLAEELDPESTGGAMLLGVDGVCIISHGSSSAKAIVNALAVARDLAAADLVGAVRAALARAPGEAGPARVAGEGE
jgi:glycerol-3-phosphate acyltransferase PlsX